MTGTGSTGYGIFETHIIPEISFFTNHPDESVRIVATDILTSPHYIHDWEKEYFMSNGEKYIASSTSPYELSDWEKHSIFVTVEEQVIKRSAIDAVYSLKLAHTEKIINDINGEIKDATSHDDVLILMAKNIRLLQAKKYFANQLGIVVIR